MNNNNYGKLITQDIKLHRNWFKQMTGLLGINCIYYAPKKDKHFDQYGDLETNYELGKVVGVIFDEHPDQKTLKKQGWVAELQEGSSMIHVPYDLAGIQTGALFLVPSGIDNTNGRLFRVISMQNIMIYPASIACEIAPEYKDTQEKTTVVDFKMSTDNLLVDNDEDD